MTTRHNGWLHRRRRCQSHGVCAGRVPGATSKRVSYLREVLSGRSRHILASSPLLRVAPVGGSEGKRRRSLHRGPGRLADSRGGGSGGADRSAEWASGEWAQSARIRGQYMRCKANRYLYDRGRCGASVHTAAMVCEGLASTPCSLAYLDTIADPREALVALVVYKDGEDVDGAAPRGLGLGGDSAASGERYARSSSDRPSRSVSVDVDPSGDGGKRLRRRSSLGFAAMPAAWRPSGRGCTMWGTLAAVVAAACSAAALVRAGATTVDVPAVVCGWDQAGCTAPWCCGSGAGTPVRRSAAAVWPAGAAGCAPNDWSCCCSALSAAWRASSGVSPSSEEKVVDAGVASLFVMVLLRVGV